MDEEHRQKYLTKYYKAKQKGVKFYPDIVYKDVLISFAIFLLLIGLAIFVGVKNEPKADPNDSAYIPRPEWYFLFLFQMLKYFPGEIEWVGTAIIPGIAVLLLILLPFIDRNPNRYWSKRKFALSFMTVIVIGIIALTLIAVVTTPHQEETGTLTSTISEQILAGQDLYSIHCVECHGAEGEGGEIKGVEGLEGIILKPINSQDEMYTRSDSTLAAIVAFGQPSLGMPPFSKAYGGELSPGDIEAIVTFMRYTWDDRAELPEEAVLAAAVPTLAPDEVPSYDLHIAPLVKRYCLSCHRPGKKNNNYFMSTYEEIMKSGDNAPNIIPENLLSNLIRMIQREEIDAGGPMPPTKALKPEIIEIFERWVLGGAPQTAEQASAAKPAPVATLPTSANPQSTTTPTSSTPVQFTPSPRPAGGTP